MPKMDDALSKLTELGANRKSGVRLRQPASEKAIRDMQVQAKGDLLCEVPSRYVDFLRLTNGVQINGTYFKEAENLVAENLDLDREDAIALGNSGGHTEFVFDSRDKKFHDILIGYDNPSASYDTFDDLLMAVLKKELAQ